MEAPAGAAPPAAPGGCPPQSPQAPAGGGPAAEAALVPRRGMYWPARCDRCQAGAARTSGWKGLLRRPCGGGDAFEWGAHDLRPEEGGWRCDGCHLFVRPGHRAEAASARCPVPRADAELQLAYRRELARQTDWRARYEGREVDAADHPGYFGGRMLPFRPHYLLGGGRRSTCLRCGRVGLARHFEGRPCVPVALLPGPAAAELHSGALDDDIALAPGWVRRRAEEAGWHPI